MRDRGKAVEIAGNNFTDFNEMPCKKHPYSSSVGICPQCLKDRLVKLVCSECGEQRLSSCSCSDVSSARISFLIESEKGADQGRPPAAKARRGVRREKAAAEEVIVLRRSSSSCVEIKKSSNGFWKIKRLFSGKSKREKGCPDEEEDDDLDHDHQVFDEMRVSRSRSLCSFRDEGSDQYRFSSAKISDVTGGLLFDGEEPRKSGFRGGGGEKPNFPFPRSVFPVKESDFSAMDESAFIDIKLDLSSSLRLSNASDHDSSSAISLSTMKPSGNGMLFGSCRLTGNGNGNGNEFEKGMKRSGKGNRVWKWISRQSSGRRSASKRDDKYY